MCMTAKECILTCAKKFWPRFDRMPYDFDHFYKIADKERLQVVLDAILPLEIESLQGNGKGKGSSGTRLVQDFLTNKKGGVRSRLALAVVVNEDPPNAAAWWSLFYFDTHSKPLAFFPCGFSSGQAVRVTAFRLALPSPGGFLLMSGRPLPSCRLELPLQRESRRLHPIPSAW
jgi:hypothetical protein